MGLLFRTSAASIETKPKTEGFAVAAVSVLAFLASATARANAPAGRAVTVIGTVTVKHAGAAAGEPLRPAMMVSQGDQIETAANGKAKLLMNDKTVLDLNASTSFKVEEFTPGATPGERQVGLALNNGKVRTAVSEPLSGKGKFIIKTKTTTMGVRGTEFIVASEVMRGPGGNANALATVRNEITVIQGRVALNDPTFPGGKTIELGAGQQLQAAAQINIQTGQITRAVASGPSGGAGSKSGGSDSGKDSKSSKDAGRGTASAPGSTKGGDAGSAPSNGGGGGDSAPVIKQVPTQKLDELRNDSKIGDLSLKDSINIEDKSRPKEAPTAPTQTAQNTSGGQGRAPASDSSKGSSILGAIGVDTGAAISGAVNTVNNAPPPVINAGTIANTISGATNFNPSSIIQPTTGNVTVRVSFKP